MNEKWSEKTVLQKVVDIISVIALCVWVIFEVLGRGNKVHSADRIACIAILIVCICEAISYWNKKRIFSYAAIAGAIVLTAVIVLQIMWF